MRAGLRVAAPSDGNAHVVEAARRDAGRVAGEHLAAPVALVRCLEPVSEVDSLAEVARAGGWLPEHERIDVSRIRIAIGRGAGAAAIPAVFAASPATCRRLRAQRRTCTEKQSGNADCNVDDGRFVIHAFISRRREKRRLRILCNVSEIFVARLGGVPVPITTGSGARSFRAIDER